MGESRLLDRDALLTGNVPVERVEIEELNGHVYVRSVPYSAAQRFWSAQDENEPDESWVLAHLGELLTYSIADASGARILDADDAAALEDRLSAGAIMQLVNAILEVSGLTEESAAEIEGN